MGWWCLFVRSQYKSAVGVPIRGLYLLRYIHIQLCIERESNRQTKREMENKRYRKHDYTHMALIPRLRSQTRRCRRHRSKAEPCGQETEIAQWSSKWIAEINKSATRSKCEQPIADFWETCCLLSFTSFYNEIPMYIVFQEEGRDQRMDTKWRKWSAMRGFEPANSVSKSHDLIRWASMGPWRGTGSPLTLEVFPTFSNPWILYSSLLLLLTASGKSETDILLNKANRKRAHHVWTIKFSNVTCHSSKNFVHSCNFSGSMYDYSNPDHGHEMIVRNC